MVLELLREESTLNQVASKYQLNPQMLSQWKSEFVKNASVVFEKSKDEAGKLQKEMDDKEARYQKIILCVCQSSLGINGARPDLLIQIEVYRYFLTTGRGKVSLLITDYRAHNEPTGPLPKGDRSPQAAGLS